MLCLISSGTGQGRCRGSGWEEVIDPASGSQFCGNPSLNCVSTSFAIPDGSAYTRVCGRVRAVQFGQASAFRFGGNGLDSTYMSGVSITRGEPPRQHIWSFAVGLTDETTVHSAFVCPCHVDVTTSPPVPAFVGTDYFCESGINEEFSVAAHDNQLFTDDILWDGEQCLVPSSQCCVDTTPYFTKDLGGAFTDDIEVRLCALSSTQGSPISLIELYVQ